ncbi:MAG: macro domain-containing protein [Pasteurellaceae bacterium]|nr:macro domain-containing protein [Pasteurellaceae bacterium]
MQRLHLIYADITKIRVDAIVNSANRSLLVGCGISSLINRKAGPIVKDACAKLNREKGGCRVGQVEVTPAGELPAQYIIHAVAPKWFGGIENEHQLLASAYRNSLIRANELTLESISFPNISTGIYKFPKQQTAEIAINSVLSTLKECDKVKDVIFSCRDLENYSLYDTILSQGKYNLEKIEDYDAMRRCSYKIGCNK